MSSNNESSGPKKLPPKKWAARIARSKSTSAMAPASPLRPSPPKITPPPPTSPMGSQKSPIDEGMALPPPSPSTPSGIPRKSWERHYRSFLKGGKKMSSKKLSTPDPSDGDNESLGPSAAPSRKMFGRKHNAAAGSVKRAPKHFRQSPASSFKNTVALPQSLNVAPLPDLSSKSANTASSSRSKSTGLLPSKSNSDTAVRGGHLFQSVFHKRGRSGSSSSVVTTDEDSSLSVGKGKSQVPPRRRIRSVDTLDSAVHKGHDKAYSPNDSATNLDAANNRNRHGKGHSPGSASFDSLDSAVHRGFEKAYSPDSARYKNTQMISIEGVPPTELIPPLVKMKRSEDDLEGSVRGGVPRGSPQPVKQSLLSQKMQEATDSFRSKSKEMKVAFTEFHNSSEFAQDSTSAYLGDEPSQHRNDHFAGIYSQRNSVFALSSSDTSFSHRHRVDSTSSLALEPVTEHVVSSMKASRVLSPLFGTDTWAAGRRYLIAPAAIAMCPNRVMKVLLAGQEDDFGKYVESLESDSPQEVPAIPSAFGSLVLGTATVIYVGRSRPSDASYGWTTCAFVLRQNYLFEYRGEDLIHEMPRGFCHLEYSTCRAHENFHDTLELNFYGSPCAKADHRTIMIRVKSEKERDWWISSLAAAAQLKIEDLYEFDETTKLGDGQYARVFPARKKCRNGNNQDTNDCALKVINKKEFWHRVQNGRERADTLVREAVVQSTLSVECGRLPNFLQTRGFFETCEHVVMELELVEGIDLFRYMSDKGVLSEKEAAHIIRDLLTSIDAMHHIGVAHRDIKPANLLMCEKENNGTSVKLADYGMSTLVGVDGLVRGRCGTPGYVAPEIFTAGIHGGYGNKVDVFSAGVTLYIMLSGYEPFYGESEAELIAANRQADVDFDDDWDRVSSNAIDLIKKMLEQDPQERIDASAALQHPWITGNVEDTTWSNTQEAMKGLSLTSTDVSNDTACTLS